jgi:ring-1,2-phenylacetyl-CoA epoxidase subunit PaaD
MVTTAGTGERRTGQPGTRQRGSREQGAGERPARGQGAGEQHAREQDAGKQHAREQDTGEQHAGKRMTEEELRGLAGSVPDPELPVLTLAELGVLRGVRVLGPGRAEVELTPTYTGCPALEAMSSDIVRVLAGHGWQATVTTTLSPAWSTDWISDEGRRKLKEFGIAPPGPARRGHGTPVLIELSVRCPHCGSLDTRLLSRFSSTACKALRRCDGCGEPFDHFKEL